MSETPDDRLDMACEFMRAIVAHCIDGGSFRYLIYERLGFGPEAYVPMYEAGGMEFTNACPINLDAEVMPSIAHAGIGVVDEIVDGVALVTFNGKAHTYKPWPGHKIKTGDAVLCIYLSTSTSGQRYALKAGTMYSALDLAEDRK